MSLSPSWAQPSAVWALDRWVITRVLEGIQEKYRTLRTGKMGTRMYLDKGHRGRSLCRCIWPAICTVNRSKQGQRELQVGVDMALCGDHADSVWTPKERSIKQEPGNMGLRTAVSKRGHREERLRSPGVLGGEEAALRSCGFGKEQNETKLECYRRRQACRCLGKRGTGGSCSGGCTLGAKKE